MMLDNYSGVFEGVVGGGGGGGGEVPNCDVAWGLIRESPCLILLLYKGTTKMHFQNKSQGITIILVLLL